jgi:hypothetical protein
MSDIRATFKQKILCPFSTMPKCEKTILQEKRYKRDIARARAHTHTHTLITVFVLTSQITATLDTDAVSVT